jgi:signal transduction histidine kinase
VGALLARLDRDWGGLLAERERTLRTSVPDTVAGRLVVAPVLRQIVAVLLDNALCHGEGTVTVTVRDLGSAIGVDVSDEGPGVTGTDPLAQTPVNGGIGLPLARRLAEAESGRLVLAVPAPPTFTLVLPTHGETGEKSFSR